MVLTVVGKGDLQRLHFFKSSDFERYELYLPLFEQKVIQDKIALLPQHIKIGSIHNATWVQVNDRLHPFDLSAEGVIGEASYQSLLATVKLALDLSARVIVIHGAAWNIYTQTKEEAFGRLASRVLPLIEKYPHISFCFETDTLWHNLYFHRRALLTNENDFAYLNLLLGGKLKITADFEHLNISYHFSEFIISLGGEENFLKRYTADSQKSFELDCQVFIKEHFKQLQAGFAKHLDSFFTRFRDRIEHIHINGSDCCSFVFDPKTTLPMVGEHLPIGFSDSTVSDRLNYNHITELLHHLPEEKKIDLVLEVWMKDERDFRTISVQSKEYIEKKLLENQHQDQRGRNMEKIKEESPAVISMNTPTKKIFIKGKEIKNFGRPFIIAEIGSNHNGDIELGKKMIDAAVAAGADAAKFQAFDEHLFSAVCYEDDARRKETIESHAALRKHLTVTHKDSLKKEMLQHVASKEMLRVFKEYCDEKGIIFFCTPLNYGIADYLVDELGMEFIKVASMDLNNLLFLEHLAKKKKPIVLSTGMGDLQEIIEAVNTIVNAGNDQIVILHCVSLYPPRDEIIHLNNIDMLRAIFNYPIGYSDHSFGTAIPLAAIAKGACMIEKHFTLDKTLPGWDHKVSADPQEMKTIVDGGLRINQALGNYHRTITQEEIDKKALFGRSIVVVRDLIAGEKIAEKDIDFRRPGTGLLPKEVKYVIGRTTKRNLNADDLVRWDDLV